MPVSAWTTRPRKDCRSNFFNLIDPGQGRETDDGPGRGGCGGGACVQAVGGSYRRKDESCKQNTTASHGILLGNADSPAVVEAGLPPMGTRVTRANFGERIAEWRPIGKALTAVDTSVHPRATVTDEAVRAPGLGAALRHLSLAPATLIGISRNAHLHVKTPAGPRRDTSIRQAHEHGPMHRHVRTGGVER